MVTPDVVLVVFLFRIGRSFVFSFGFRVCMSCGFDGIWFSLCFWAVWILIWFSCCGVGLGVCMRCLIISLSAAWFWCVMVWVLLFCAVLFCLFGCR